MLEKRKERMRNVPLILVALCLFGRGTSLAAYEYERKGDFGAGFGQTVSIDGDYAIISAPGDDCAYIFKHVAGNWTEQCKLSVPDAPKGFGAGVAISGTVALVGSVGWADEGDTGRAWVFRGADSHWELEAVLSNIRPNSADTPVPGQQYGASLCVWSNPDGDGELVAVGAPGFGDSGGRVYLYSSMFWCDPHEDCPPDLPVCPPKPISCYYRWDYPFEQIVFDGAPGDRFGSSVSGSGDTVVIGAPGHAENGIESGAVHVFRRADDTGFFDPNWSY